jgi:hypothetical protein
MLNLCHELLACSYTNDNKSIQIVRISQPASSFLERTVLPGQTIDFMALASSSLEIYGVGSASMLRVDTVSCEKLAQSQSLKPVDEFVRARNSRNKNQDMYLQSVG